MKRYINGIYAKAVKTQYGELINLTIHQDALNELISNLNTLKRTVRITIAERREADKYGNTHTVFYNDYVPEAKPASSEPAKSEPEEDDLPF